MICKEGKVISKLNACTEQQRHNLQDLDIYQFKNIFSQHSKETNLEQIMNRQAHFNTMRAQKSKPKNLNLGDDEMNVG